MAGRSRRSSTELEPDLSKPTISKQSKLAETSAERSASASAEEYARESECSRIEAPSTSESHLQTQVAFVSEGVGESGGGGVRTVAESSETHRRSSWTEASLERNPQLSGQTIEIARSKSTWTEATASSSRAAPRDQLGGGPASEAPAAIVQAKCSDQRELSDPSGKTPEATVQIQTSLLGEHHASYEDLCLIGNGAYGTVYKAKDKTGQVVALKKVRVPLTEDGLPISTVREIATLKQLEQFEHPHIVRLLDVCQGNYLELPSDDGERSGRLDRGLTLWLVFEHVERDLASYIASRSQSAIPSYLVKQMSREILCGVEFLHSHRIIHRDLKPQNLLVTRQGRIKIADFGLAKTYDFEMRLTSVVVTQWYRAPEVLLGCSYATPVDIWSVGCIMAEICKLEPLFPGTSEGDQLDRIFQVLGTPSRQAWPENVSLSWTAFPRRQPRPLGAIIPDLNEHGLDLVKSMLTFDPHSRITAAQAVIHGYFSEDDA